MQKLLTQLLEKTGSLGTIISAMGCGACFPALASLGASLGLGFLVQFEGVFINTLLPIFAVIALIANIANGMRYRLWYRMIAGFAGPLMVLATLYLFWTASWSTTLFYVGLGSMLLVSLWNLVSPPHAVCCATQKQTHQEA